MRVAIVLLAAALAGACGNANAPSTLPPSLPATTQPPTGPVVRVLMITATAGFRHDSIAAARQTLMARAAATGEFTVTATENIPDVTADRLASVDVVMFALTSGELPFDAGQKKALADFVSHGGGFIGIHSASDTLYDWPEYGRLVGAYFKEHPWTQEATVLVEDRTDPSTVGLGPSFRISEEFYAFRDNPRPSVHVLLSLDASSVGAAGDYPLAWSHTIGNGRAYYNALGHFTSTWNDPRFQSQILGAIRWVGRRL